MNQAQPTPFTEAIATLNDRALRRLLGARAFLRGYDYVRRHAVENVQIEAASAKGQVRGTEPEPYDVSIQLAPPGPNGQGGITSQCSCPAFSKINGHCKHVAALLIAVRDQFRPPKPQMPQQPQAAALPAVTAGPNGVSAYAVPLSDGGGGGRRGRRARARALKQAQMAAHGLIARQGTEGKQGVDAWLAEPMPPQPKIEYRIEARQTSLAVRVLESEARLPLLPSALLVPQSQAPTPDREALRLLARLESEQPRRVGIDVRGEDACDLLDALRGRRVILEPQMMELRYNDEPLRAHFELELSQDGTSVLVKSFFTRTGDPRKFLASQGAWFEGSPGWHVDVEGFARPIDKRVSPASLRRLIRQPVIHESIDRLPQLIAQGLPRAALEVGAELPELSQVADVVDIEPTFRLRAGGSLTEAHVSLRAAYEDVEIDVRADGMTPPVIVKPPNPGSKRARCIRCDIAAQQAAASKLRDLGLAPDEDGQGFVVRGDGALKFWTDGITTLPEEWDLYAPDDLVDVQMRDTSLAANVRVSSGVDWLSLRMSFESEGIAVTQEELARCLAEGRRYVRLQDGSFARIDPEKVKEVLARQAEILATSGSSGGKIPLSQAGRIEELLSQVNRSTVSDGAKELFKKLRDIDEIKATKKPRNLKATLRPYQESGFQWLAFLHEIASGGVLADDMGLGKTVQTIAVLLAVKSLVEKSEDKKKFRALIVAPTSVVTNWLREMDKFAPSLKHALWHGAERKEREDELSQADVVVTSYALLRRDEELLAKQNWTYAILDEAQNIKNPLSATARAAKRLKSDRRLALTGTPIENRLSEIWSIFDFVSPGLLGDLAKFEERYSRPIDAGDPKAAQRLRATIHPFILRRTKSEVAKDLPEKIETDQICDLTGEQGALYQQVLKEVRAQVMGEVERQGLARAQIQILAGLTRLRQAACDPRLLGLPRQFSDEDSGKLMALRDLIQTSIDGGHRVLVFSQFVSMLTIIRRALDEDKVSYEYLDGSTKDRQSIVERFQQEHGAPVFLISLKAGGSGLNLTGADTVIHFDPWWNPAVEDQATDRAHRIGQTKVVTTYRLIAKGTIEEKILELGGKKRELVGAVLSEDMGGTKKLTKSDLEDLFKFD
ncbi:MAG TPA: SNF2-related protein [Polyangiaceae bacterium]